MPRATGHRLQQSTVTRPGHVGACTVLRAPESLGSHESHGLRGLRGLRGLCGLRGQAARVAGSSAGSSSSRSARVARARATRDRTVPTGQPLASAASA